jgi:hypothetical protein
LTTSATRVRSGCADAAVGVALLSPWENCSRRRNAGQSRELNREMPMTIVMDAPLRRAARMLAMMALMVISAFGSCPDARAAVAYAFESGADGWTNQPTEAFVVTFAPGQGSGGGGGLSIAATGPRDSYQLVHAPDPDWPATHSHFTTITFDARLAPGVQLELATTGMQIRSASNSASNVYLANSITDLGGGWIRVSLRPTNLTDLPASHPDVGLNLHLGTTRGWANTPIATLDNIRGSTATEYPAQGVPTLSALALAVLASLCLILAMRSLGNRNGR